VNGTPKNVPKVEESQTQKKSGTAKMANELMNLEGVKKDKPLERGEKSSKTRISSAKERKSSQARPISAKPQDKLSKKSASGCPKPESKTLKIFD